MWEMLLNPAAWWQGETEDVTWLREGRVRSLFVGSRSPMGTSVLVVGGGGASCTKELMPLVLPSFLVQQGGTGEILVTLQTGGETHPRCNHDHNWDL